MKASEKQELTKKLVARLEKQFGRIQDEPDRSVLDTLLFAVCLENASIEAARKSFGILQNEFHDLNEIRVSSISELALPFSEHSDADLRAHRVRTILQYVFEDQFEFDLEGIRKKTQDQAVKKLGQIRDLSAFIRNYVQQAALGAHVVPLDDRQVAAVIWLGLADAGTSPENASEQLKAAVRKADSAVFCQLLRMFATDSPAAEMFTQETWDSTASEYAATDALKRVDEALKGKTNIGKAKAAAKETKVKPKATKTAKGTKTAKVARPAKSAKAKKAVKTTKADSAEKKTVKKSTTKKSTGAAQSGKDRSRARS